MPTHITMEMNDVTADSQRPSVQKAMIDGAKKKAFGTLADLDQTVAESARAYSFDARPTVAPRESTTSCQMSASRITIVSPQLRDLFCAACSVRTTRSCEASIPLTRSLASRSILESPTGSMPSVSG